MNTHTKTIFLTYETLEKKGNMGSFSSQVKNLKCATASKSKLLENSN